MPRPTRCRSPGHAERNWPQTSSEDLLFRSGGRVGVEEMQAQAQMYDYSTEGEGL